MEFVNILLIPFATQRLQNKTPMMISRERRALILHEKNSYRRHIKIINVKVPLKSTLFSNKYFKKPSAAPTGASMPKI